MQFSAVQDAQKLRLYRGAELALINSYCPFRPDRLHVRKLPSCQNTIIITRTPIDAKLNTISLTCVLFPFDDLNHDGRIPRVISVASRFAVSNVNFSINNQLEQFPMGCIPPHPAPGKARLRLGNPSQPSPPGGERAG